MNTAATTRLRERLQRVIDSISAALEQGDAPPDLETLAGDAHFSPFHFHRLWRALTGEPIGATVARLRLRRALVLLGDPAASVTDAAMAVGFQSSQAFARLVRQHLETTPGALRDSAAAREAADQRLDRPLRPAAPPPTFVVDVVSLTPFEVLLTSVTGGDDAMAEAFGALLVYAAEAGKVEAITGLWSIEHDDRRDVPSAACRAEAMLALSAGTSLRVPAGIAVVLQGGGRYARARVTGPYAGIESAIDVMLGTWWPTCGEVLAERPLLFHYLDDPETTPVDVLRTDVHLPLA